MKQIEFKIEFDEYLKSVFQTEVDLRFWKRFLTISIEKFREENQINSRINEAGFSIYNIQPNGLDTWLHASSEIYSIETKDLDIQKDNFFVRIMNLTIIRVYNAVELLLLCSIQKKYFDGLPSPSLGKKETNKILSEIKAVLKKEGKNADSTNNRHIIEFLIVKSTDFVQFLNLPVNVQMDTNWRQFFEFFSLLRNIITHHAMNVSKDIRNTINSYAKDVFREYFEQTSIHSKDKILRPKDEYYFLNFISLVNDFAANSVKFIAGEKDFIFIGLHKI